jgi:hypothetical protein
MWFALAGSEAFRQAASRSQRQQDILELMFLRATMDHGNMKGRQRAYAATFLGLINTYISLGLNGYAKLDQALVTMRSTSSCMASFPEIFLPSFYTNR